jgi:hypothetical protein
LPTDCLCLANYVITPAITLLSGGVKIYAIANHIFIGDDTQSAQGHVLLGDVTLTTAVVPLPPSVVLSLVAFATTLSMRRKPQAKNQAPIT